MITKTYEEKKKQLNFKQQIALRRMMEDIGDQPTDMSLAEMQVKYGCSTPSMATIMNFLQQNDMVERSRQGYRFITRLKPSVLDYIVNPLNWCLENLKNHSAQNSL